MYTKVKKVKENSIDKKLELICKDFMVFNDDTSFAISRTFIEEAGIIKSEVPCAKIIVVSKNIKELIIPSSYVLLKNNYITDFYDRSLRIKLVYSEIEITDGIIKGKEFERANLKFTDQDKIHRELCKTRR